MKDRIMDWFGNALVWIIERPIIFFSLILVLVVAFGIGAWNLKRWVNWELAYGDDVKMAVCEMVKPEALKDPSVCKKNDE